MVWFQCEDCGENLKKPKLQNHFRICSAKKLSCIDCGVIFTQATVQGHQQCITEAEKYGPKGQGKASTITANKPKTESNQNSDVDINVGLSSRPPWFCSLCNTNATSNQALSLHAEGKKHRAKARAFHAANQNTKLAAEPKPNENEPVANGHAKSESRSWFPKVEDLSNTKSLESEKEKLSKEKRKMNKPHSGGAEDLENGNGELNNGKMVGGNDGGQSYDPPQKRRCISDSSAKVDQNGDRKSIGEIKWKKLITSILKSSPEGTLKLRKLRKRVLDSLKESGITQDKSKLKELFSHKVSSSSWFIVNGDVVQLAPKN
ncbi:UBP1-associated proteins 1C [Amborella trichopoda]|uniref:U1-type domain-containing protein n=1 Tax=Amborella trichopoda TaxID=13333 RepID=W1PA99_AMBTC|nr:UBP1-associated proteins 1C [Amborella trichopoda]ERN04853.1 hypothetical protein AMTR_s00146p00068870 [Amborella trichopoda]|eukprot:XP_006843178.1 UBP1-associated proteins 1C [Amborella trichopoda]